MLRPVLSESIGENSFARLITWSAAWKTGTTTVSTGECVAPDSPLNPINVPSDTTLASVPLESAIVRRLREKNAATGKERKLAEASPSAANNAIQQKMIPRPRTKFTPNPLSRYSTSMPSCSGNNNATSFGLRN